jgi:DNA-binding LacI/PurR family transcriptional regulator
MASEGRTRIADIAAKLGVSTATVSRAISGKGYVREELAAQIRTAAMDMNYGLPERTRGKRVMLIVSNDAMIDFQRSQFTMHVLDGLKQRAAKSDIVIEQHTFQSVDKINRLEAVAREEGIIGALLLTIDDSELELARRLPVPVILVNSDDPDMQIGSVTPCNRSAAALATKHLVELGHERILFINKPGRRTILRRLEGMKDVLGDCFDPALVVDADDWTVESARNATERALADGLDFSAILAAGDVLAAGAIVGLQAAGLDVPNDISVVGIDGLPQGEFMSPPLTTVTIPMSAVGALSLEQLMATATRRNTLHELPVSRIELACAMTVRASTSARC